MPREGNEEMTCACSGVRTVLSMPSITKASPIPLVSPRASANAILRGTLGSAGIRRSPGNVNNAKIVGVKAGAHARFFQPFQQAFVESAVGVHIALQQTVLDRALVQLVGFLFLLLHGFFSMLSRCVAAR